MPPVVIAAGVAGVAGIAAGAMGSKAQSKAASKAANSAASTAASNNALARENREFSAQRLDPYAQRGNEAGNAINSLLGIAGTAAPSGASSGVDWAGYVNGNPDAAANWNAIRNTSDGQQFGGDAGAFGQYHYGADGSRRDLAPYTKQAVTDGSGGSANNAFQNYLGSTGYQFQMDQGTKAINQGYAANGSLQSGAAMKALQTYGQNTGTGFFKDYLGLLANQQGVGLSGASAVAGVGQNYVNSVSANNNAMGTAQQNAYLQQGNATAGMWGNVAGAVGGVANAFGSSYGRPSQLPPPRAGYATPGYGG